MAKDRSDLLKRTIRFLTSNGQFVVRRQRDSEGGVCISVSDREVDEPLLVLSCNDAGDQNYEVAARSLGEALIEASNEPCLLSQAPCLLSRPGPGRRVVDTSKTGE